MAKVDAVLFPFPASALRKFVASALTPLNTTQRNVAAVASHWQLCIRFDPPEICASGLPF